MACKYIGLFCYLFDIQHGLLFHMTNVCTYDVIQLTRSSVYI